MTNIYLDDDPMYHTDVSPNVDNRVHTGYYTRITFHGIKTDNDYQKEIKFIRIPRLAKSDRSAKPITTYGLDFGRITEVYTLTGHLTTDSSKWYDAINAKGSLIGTSATVRAAADDLIKMIKAGGQIHLNWGTTTDIDVVFSKVKITEISTDEDTPTQYGVNLVLVQATNR